MVAGRETLAVKRQTLALKRHLGFLNLKGHL